jgi:hypothetical protein
MDFKKFEAKFNGQLYEIDQDFPEVGAYLFIYEDNVCIRYELQNTIKICMERAFKKLGSSFRYLERSKKYQRRILINNQKDNQLIYL